MNEICLECNRAIQWTCCVCKKNLCELCGAVSYKGKVYCQNCDQKYNPSFTQRTSKEFSFEKVLMAYEIFTISEFVIGFVVVICMLIWGPKGEVSLSGWKTLFVLIPLLLLFLVNSFFWLVLRCPNCDSFVLFYFSNDWFELFRFKNCARCGYQLRN